MNLFDTDLAEKAKEYAGSGMILKRGYIKYADGAEYWETSDFYAYPKCPACEKPMKETDVYLRKDIYARVKEGLSELPWDRIPVDTPLFVWFCKTPACREAVSEFWRGRVRKHQKEEKAQISDEILKKYNIPALYAHCTLGTFNDHPKSVEFCKGYVADPKKSLLFTGGTGTGKTHLAVAVLKELHGAGQTKLYFCGVTDLLIDITTKFRNEEEESYPALIERMAEYDWLVLDDLGAEKPTEFAVTTLYTIVNRRLNFGKHTIMTTNLTLDEIKNRLSERIASRLASYMIVPFKMPDYRRKRT